MMFLSTRQPFRQESVRAEPDTNIIANIELLESLSLSIGSLTNAQYVHQYNESTSSIGKHIRHIIDHYTCFFRNLAHAYVNYDDRSRTITVETKIHRACEELSGVILRLSKFNPHQTKPVHIYICSDEDVWGNVVEGIQRVAMTQWRTLIALALAAMTAPITIAAARAKNRLWVRLPPDAILSFVGNRRP